MKKNSSFKMRSGNKPSMARLSGVEKSPMNKNGDGFFDQIKAKYGAMGPLGAFELQKETRKKRRKIWKSEFRKYVEASNKNPKKYPPISSDEFTSEHYITPPYIRKSDGTSGVGKSKTRQVYDQSR